MSNKQSEPILWIEEEGVKDPYLCVRIRADNSREDGRRRDYTFQIPFARLEQAGVHVHRPPPLGEEINPNDLS